MSAAGMSRIFEANLIIFFGFPKVLNACYSNKIQIRILQMLMPGYLQSLPLVMWH